MTDTLSVTELLDRYRQAAAATATLDENEASRQAYQAHTYFKTLRETQEGRAGVSALMDDADSHVRRWAATHSLMWDRERAREVLSSLGTPAES
jgi:hypothetical protein